MKIWKYTFCREFTWGHTLEFLWWWCLWHFYCNSSVEQYCEL